MFLNKIYPCLLFGILFLSGCKKDENTSTGNDNNSSIPLSAAAPVNISTDKAVYLPGEQVSFTIDKSVPATCKIRYRHLNETVQESDYKAMDWKWNPPATDFTGYLADIYNIENKREVIYGSIAIDVSSDWKRFPRYGFLSGFPLLNDSQMDGAINNLSRYHINGLQFYDWTEKHHKPLAGTQALPSQNWLDIAGRPTYKSTVEGYITRAHMKGMKAMSYNLCYGSLNDASADGVISEWYMYDDVNHQKKTVFDIGSFLKSPIYLMDPSNPDWQKYLADRNNEMYSVYGFDGYHIDQLGDWGSKFNYNGATLNVAAAFGSFIAAMKSSRPDKRLVFNSVNQYGQQASIAGSDVDFLYTEVWSPNDTYLSLANILNDNSSFSPGKKSILAAYINYKLADKTGSFNIPSVLFADAVIFAFGGAHLELGEHMLGKEYFPNSNLQMSEELKKSLVAYYDFSVAYQNLLRDGGNFNSPSVSAASGGSVPVSTWPPQTGSVSVAGKIAGGKQVLHLINFRTNSTDWRDTDGTKTIPSLIQNLKLEYYSSGTVKKIWFASPDLNSGIAFKLPFQQNGNTVSFIVPSLKYWDMIVIE